MHLVVILWLLFSWLEIKVYNVSIYVVLWEDFVFTQLSA